MTYKIYCIFLEKGENDISLIETFLDPKIAEDYRKINQDTDITKKNKKEHYKLFIVEKEFDFEIDYTLFQIGEIYKRPKKDFVWPDWGYYD